MAKISTYPVVSTPSLSSMLIGTDLDDANNTKNFTIGDVLSLIDVASFVPYTGATGDVNLGSHNIVTTNIDITGFLLLNGDPGIGGYIPVSNDTVAPPSWSKVENTFTSWRGSFYDVTTQTLTGGANVAVPVILGLEDNLATNGVSVVSDGAHLTRITVQNEGVYNFMFSAQLANSGGSAQVVDFWLCKNGSTAAANIPDTNGKIQLQSNNSYVMAAWNYFVKLQANDYIQLMWTATSTNVTMVTEAANAVHPATPSIIVTLNKV